MKIKLFIFFLVFFISFTKNVYSNIKDGIIAKIWNEIVTNYDIINEINSILALSNKPADENDFKKLQSIAFSSIKKTIIKKIEIEKYKINNYSVEDFNNYLFGLEKNLGLQNITLEEHFKKYRANFNIFKDHVIINLKWNTLIYSLYKKELDVDEELIKTELNRQLAKEKKIEEFNLSEIVLEDWNENKFIEIQKSIKNNGFEKTATIYSNSVSSTKGGAIGWVSSKSISKDYLEVISKMDKMQISKPVKVNNNVVIIKLNDKRILNQNNLNVKKIEKNVIQKKKEEKLNIFSNSHYLDLERKTYIEINE